MPYPTKGMEDMELGTSLATEVYIRKNHAYLPHVCKIVSSIAAGSGMSRGDAEQMERAVSEVCLNSMDPASDSQGGGLSIRLSTGESFVCVEVTDTSSMPVSLGWVVNGELQVPDGVSRLVDGIEILSGDEGATVRITKSSRKPDMTPGVVTPCLAVGTAGLPR